MHADSEVPNARFPGAEENSETFFFPFFPFFSLLLLMVLWMLLRIAIDSVNVSGQVTSGKGRV